jgi:hypothetical protein
MGYAFVGLLLNISIIQPHSVWEVSVRNAKTWLGKSKLNNPNTKHRTVTFRTNTERSAMYKATMVTYRYGCRLMSH